MRGATSDSYRFVQTSGISTHTPLARRDLFLASNMSITMYFYSHASCEARPLGTITPTLAPDFYSHASCEARRRLNQLCKNDLKFLLTRLLRGATSPSRIQMPSDDISTHTPLARRDLNCVQDLITSFISTHTPLARRDLRLAFATQALLISTHTPLARRDDNAVSRSLACSFLLTRLLRGATL